MATKFLEPGGDADFLSAGTTNGFWSVGMNGGVATDFVHGTHARSLNFRPGIADAVNKGGVMADSGTRFSAYIYIVTLPNATATISGMITGGGTNMVSFRLTSAGILQLWRATTNQIGSNGPTLATGQWYRISLAYTVTSTTINRFEAFVDGNSAISVTNATLGTTGSDTFRIGNIGTNATLDFRSSDHYIDDSASLVDTGNIWVTAKRPNANGTTNGFTLQVGSGGSGYGSGHSPQVNERPLSVTNGWSIVGVGNAVTEEYNIEGQGTGDINMTNYPLLDYLGWISVKTVLSETINVIVNGVNYSQTTTANFNNLYTKIAGSTTYPAGSGADIGVTTDTTITTVTLNECGVVAAYNFTLSVSVSDSVTISESVTEQRIGGAWVAVDNFNSYSDGELGGDNGGTGWSDAWEAIFGSGFMVEGSVTNEGAKAISFSDSVQSIAWYKRDLTQSVSSGIVSFAMRLNDLDNSDVEASFTDTSFEHGRVRMGNSGALILSTNDGEAVLRDNGFFFANVWYTIHVEIDGVNSRFRGRVDNDAWSDWVYEIDNPFSDITRMIVYMVINLPGAVAYFDTIGVGSNQTALVVSVSEAVTVTENNTFSIGAKISVFDSATVSEGVSLSLPLPVKPFESVTVTESVTLLERALPLVFDSVTVSENVSLSLRISVAPFETVTLTENVVIVIPTLLAVFDSIAIVEAVILGIPSATLFFEVVLVNDVPSLSIPTLYLQVNDSVTVSENIVLSIPLPFSVSDSITVSEGFTLSLPPLVTVNDLITASEAVSLNCSIPLLAESVSVSEVVSFNIPVFVSVFDSVTVSENIQAILLLEVFYELVTVTTNIAIAVITPLPLIHDSVTVSESRTLAIPLPVVTSDLVTVTTGPFTLFFNGYQMRESRPLGDIAYYYSEGSSTAPQMGLSIGGGL